MHGLYNTSLQPTTGYSPFFLMHVQMNPIELAYGTSDITPSHQVNINAAALQKMPGSAYERVWKNFSYPD